MSKTIKKIGILLGIFVIAVVIYFVWAQRAVQKEDVTVYTSMEEPALPVVYVDMYGREMNPLHGYTQDLKQAVARESLTVLPPDLGVNIRIAGYAGAVTGISYEVRSLDLERLVERTTLSEWSVEGEGVSAHLPIQNLLTKDTEYLLVLSLETERHGTINYYTRIVYTDNENVEQLIAFAADFTNKTFDYEQARELVTYLETTNTEDNSSLGHVTIRSSFSQLTWAGLDMAMDGPAQVTLKELDGIMCNMEVRYEVIRASETGEAEQYEVVDNYTMKWDPQRIYLMDFERKMNQIFSGRKDLFSGKRILLGITNDENVKAEKSPDGNRIAFVANRDLWMYDQKEKDAVKVFSFRSGLDEGNRGSYSQHQIKVLELADTGDMEFLVYGYMNRGNHEGNMGIAMYHYSAQEDTIQEKFFAPVVTSFERLDEEIRRLAHLGSNGMLYLMVGHGVYAIDLNSNEYMVLADDLMEGGYAVSDTQRHLAWQEGGGLYDSSKIHLMDLDTGSKQEITGAAGDKMRVLGFVGDDFIYGMAREQDLWVKNGRTVDLPMYALEIMGAEGEIEKHDENSGVYIADVSVEDGRVHLNRVAPKGGQDYAFLRTDTIVCNQTVGEDPLAGIGWYASEERRKLYFVQADRDIQDNRDIRVTTPGKVIYDTSQVLNLKANTEPSDTEFYAYGGGHYLGASRSLSDAIALAYERMGIVVDQNQSMIWNRVNRSTARNIKDPFATASQFLHYVETFEGNKTYGDGVAIFDARGCKLGQMLYFIDKGCPVAAYMGEGSFVLLSGYDQYNVSIYNPATQETVKMGLNDTAATFESLGNDFMCGLFTK